MLNMVIINQISRNIFFIFLLLILIFFIQTELFAAQTELVVYSHLLTEDAIVLDESVSRELIYISPDYSILVFRSPNPQLAKITIGDVLYLDSELTKDKSFLGQIINMIIEEDGLKGIIIQMVPWSENHCPIISGLIARPPVLEVKKEAALSCYAADVDGDTLLYSWYANKGILRGYGASATWISPHEPGDYFISCEVTDNRGGKDDRTIQIQVLDKISPLTKQEAGLIRKYGWGGNRSIRWPDGYVAVYDATNFFWMQEVLDEWNEVVGGKVVFYLSSNPQSPVKINYNYELSRKNLCSHIDTHWRDYQLYAGEIQINPDSWLCGFPGNLYAAYLHCFSGVAGFNVWQGTTIDRADWQDFTMIPEIIQEMIKALYQVSPGYNL